MAAFEVCTQRGSFTSTDAVRMRVVSKAFYVLIRDMFQVESQSHKPFCKSELQVRKGTSVYDMDRGMANGATSGVEGVSGSLNPKGFVRILSSVEGGIY